MEFLSKKLDWVSGMETPLTVMTTRATAVLTNKAQEYGQMEWQTK